MVMLTVLYFAIAREITGKRYESIDMRDECSVNEFVKTLVAKYPSMEPLLGNVVLSVNLKYVSIESNQILKTTDEIAFIPAISGG